MVNYIIREIQDNELKGSLEVIRKSFGTVAKDFGLTKENCLTNGAFIEIERLVSDISKGIKMFGLFVNNEQMGFVAVAKQNGSIYEIEKLAVLPSYRHLGYGKVLMDFTRQYIKSQNGEAIVIGIINENRILKQWYSAYGFVEIGTKVFSHLPFTVCFMELEV